MFLFIILTVFSIGMSRMVSLLYPLMFNCRGGGWYVMCAKSVAVTSLCVHCFDKNFVFLYF